MSALHGKGKGKINVSEWQTIFMRHSGGESFASIARSYGCTGPAIRYIVRRLRDTSDTKQNRSGSKIISEEREAESLKLPQATIDNESIFEPRDPQADKQPSTHSAGKRELHSTEPVETDHEAFRNPFTWFFLDRINGDIAAFLVALDAVANEPDDPSSLKVLREASDRLIRAGARTRMEIDILFSRVSCSSANSRAAPNRLRKRNLPSGGGV